MIDCSSGGRLTLASTMVMVVVGFVVVVVVIAFVIATCKNVLDLFDRIAHDRCEISIAIVVATAHEIGTSGERLTARLSSVRHPRDRSLSRAR